jgi:hypothetical protein
MVTLSLQPPSKMLTDCIVGIKTFVETELTSIDMRPTTTKTATLPIGTTIVTPVVEVTLFTPIPTTATVD